MSDGMKIDPKRHYTTTTAATFLGVSASTLRGLERQGRLECTRTPGGQRRFSGTELLRLQEESTVVPRRKSGAASAYISETTEDALARQAWLGTLIAGTQRDLPPDTPAEIRLRLSADIERSMVHFGPSSPPADLRQLVKSLIERAARQRHATQEDAERREMKRELIDFGLAQLRRRIDGLAPRLVGPKTSLKRCHVQASLRDEFKATLHRELRGDEDWDHVRTRTEEFVAAWHVGQVPTSRIPEVATLIAAGATGAIGGAAATATLSPEIRARLAQLKAPLRTMAENLLSLITTPPPPASASTNPSEQASPPSATAPPPPFRPVVDPGVGWPPAYRARSAYAPPGAHPSQKAPPRRTPAAPPTTSATSAPTAPEPQAHDHDGARDPVGGS